MHTYTTTVAILSNDLHEVWQGSFEVEASDYARAMALAQIQARTRPEYGSSNPWVQLVDIQGPDVPVREFVPEAPAEPKALKKKVKKS